MFLTHAISLLYDSALAVVYPQPCTVCGVSVESRFDGIACRDCWLATRIFSGSESVCGKCGALLNITVGGATEAAHCKRCEEEMFTAARSCGMYEKALRAAVLSLKSEPHVPRVVTDFLVSAAERPPLDQSTRIVPVPLHPERERARGFNQAEIIARELSRRRGLPLDTTSLYRTVHTRRHRAGMDAKARRETVDDAFVIRNPPAVRDETILLVDDVFTTGATASSCASVLLDAGATAVFVLTLARAC